MVDVSCGACNAAFQLDDADVPPSGKIIKCRKCGESITIPPSSPGFTGGPAVGSFELDDDILDLGEPLGAADLADLPAPVRPSPLAAAAPSGRDEDSISIMDLPAPAGTTPTRGVSDLPAPVRASGGRAGLADLPAPVGASSKRGIPDLPAPVGASSKRGIPDLPAPVGPSARRGIPDLPAPVGAKASKGLPDLPAPVGAKASKGLPDLPAPVGAKASKGLPDLPAPVGAKASKGLPDLPAPVGALPSKGLPDLPAPVGALPSKGLPDLPAPVGASPTKGIDLPTPVGALPSKGLPDLPAPVGASPTKGIDLPAPKGFFDNDTSGALDLEPPAGFAPAPIGGPNATEDLFADVAPKPALDGLDFDMGPGPSGGASIELDLPANTAAALGGSGRSAGGPSGSLDLDDLELSAPPSAPVRSRQPTSPPHRASAGGPQASAPKSAPAPLDLDGLDLAAPLDLGDGVAPLDLGGGEAPLDFGNAGALELDGDANKYDDLDLPGASAPGGGGAGFVSFDASPTAPADEGLSFAPARTEDDALDLIDDRPASQRPSAAAKKQAAAISPLDEEEAAALAKRKKKRKIVLAGALAAVLAAGAGGFVFYQKQQDKAAATAKLKNQVVSARNAIGDDARGHWDLAARAAEKALKVSPGNADALGMGAQAYFAAILDEGGGADVRMRKGKALITQIVSAAANGVEVEKAQALASILDGQTDRGIERLSKVLKDKPTDPDALLYRGWGHLLARDFTAAKTDFEASAKHAPTRKTAPLYGVAKALDGMGDTKAARNAYLLIIADRDKDHIGALVGAEKANTDASFSEREAAFLSILRRKDIESADPRAVALALAMAGQEAANGGRFDVAEERFAKALSTDGLCLEAVLGRARAAMAQNNLEVAKARIGEVLAIAPAHVEAMLTKAEILAKVPDEAGATEALAAVTQMQPPLTTPSILARVATVEGSLAEARGDITAAVEKYRSAYDIVGERDIAPGIKMVRLLLAAGRRADAAGNPTDAQGFRDEADRVLKPMAARAQSDASVALNVGVAFLAADQAARAEEWFNRALTTKPRDVEALLQLGFAQSAQGKTAEAIATIRKAIAEDETREDVGLALAQIYEESGNRSEAGVLYKKLIAGRAPSLNLRARAGRFFAREGDAEIVAALADQILEAQPSNATGLFLRGESLLVQGNFKEAFRAYDSAVQLEPNGQFLDGLGRANEALGVDGDLKAREGALTAYTRASQADATLLNPLLGRGRIYLSRRDYPKALEVLDAALRLAPNNAEALYGIGLCYHAAQDFKRAIDSLAKAVRAPNPSANAYYYLGVSYFEYDKLRDAAAALTSAVRLGEKEDWHTDALWLLGSIERTLGNKPNAIRAWDAYLSKNPTNEAKVADVKKLLLRLKAR